MPPAVPALQASVGSNRQPARAVLFPVVFDPTLHPRLHQILGHAVTDWYPGIVVERGLFCRDKKAGACRGCGFVLCGIENRLEFRIVVSAIVVATVMAQKVEEVAGVIEIG